MSAKQPTCADTAWNVDAPGVYSNGVYVIRRVASHWEIRRSETSALVHCNCRSLKEAKAWIERIEADATRAFFQGERTRAERAARMAYLCQNWTHRHIHLDAGRLRLLIGAARTAEALGEFLRGLHYSWPECPETCSGERCDDECPDRRWPETSPSGCETHPCCDSPKCRHDRVDLLAEQTEHMALDVQRLRPLRAA